MLEMSAEMHAAMVAHAIAGLPHEACGLFAGLPGSHRIERFFPMRNAAESREIYVLDGPRDDGRGAHRRRGRAHCHGRDALPHPPPPTTRRPPTSPTRPASTPSGRGGS